MQQRLHCTGIIYQLKQDRMCNCNTVTRRYHNYHLVRAAPRHPASLIQFYLSSVSGGTF